MTNRFALQPILDLSQMKLDEATRHLGELLNSQQKAADRLTLLTQYRSEYHARFLSAAQEGMSREQWLNYSNFLARVDDAITQAQNMVAHTERLTEAGKAEWRNNRSRVKAFDTLAQRHLAKEHHVEAVREQKILDEHTSRVLRSRTTTE